MANRDEQQEIVNKIEDALTNLFSIATDVVDKVNENLPVVDAVLEGAFSKSTEFLDKVRAEIDRQAGVDAGVKNESPKHPSRETMIEDLARTSEKSESIARSLWRETYITDPMSNENIYERWSELPNEDKTTPQPGGKGKSPFTTVDEIRKRLGF